MKVYPTEASAIRFMERIRWGDTAQCVRCGTNEAITPQNKVGYYWCGDCRQYFNVQTGTPMEGNKVDPRRWMFAAYLLMTSRKGIRVSELGVALSVTYNTASLMIHRLKVSQGRSLQTLNRLFDN